MHTARLIQRGTLAGSLALVSAMVSAGTATNTMTSVATVTDACDVVAIGIDFGIMPFPIPAAGITKATPNTTVGNAATGNTGHPNAANDGGAGNNDVLTLSTADATTNTLISTVLGTVTTTAAGVFVACTTTPTSITVTSGAAGATPYNLPTTFGGTPSGSLSGKLGGVSGGATGSNTLTYTLTFLGTPVSTAVGGLLPTIFVASFLATGNIPASQSGVVVPGYYTDVATAQVNF